MVRLFVDRRPVFCFMLFYGSPRCIYLKCTSSSSLLTSYLVFLLEQTNVFLSLLLVQFLPYLSSLFYSFLTDYSLVAYNLLCIFLHSSNRFSVIHFMQFKCLF